MAKVGFNMVGTAGTVSVEAKDITDIESGLNPFTNARHTKISFGTEATDEDGDKVTAGQDVLVMDSLADAITKVAAALAEHG